MKVPNVDRAEYVLEKYKNIRHAVMILQDPKVEDYVLVEIGIGVQAQVPRLEILAFLKKMEEKYRKEVEDL